LRKDRRGMTSRIPWSMMQSSLSACISVTPSNDGEGKMRCASTARACGTAGAEGTRAGAETEAEVDAEEECHAKEWEVGRESEL
jgi:hypothetical protein